MALSKHHHRQQPSDPFSDQATISYSSYGVPTLSRNAPPQQSATRPPAVPPKVPPKASRMPNGDNVAEAVRDVVTVRRVENQNQNPRTRMGRSQTQLPPYVSNSPLFGQTFKATYFSPPPDHRPPDPLLLPLDALPHKTPVPLVLSLRRKTKERAAVLRTRRARHTPM